MRLSLFFIAAAVFAETGVDAPSIGIMRDTWGMWRPVQGVAGSFVLGSITGEPEPWPASTNKIEQRGDTYFVLAPDGSTIGALPPEAHEPILLLDDAVLYTTDDALVIGNVRIPCSGVTALRQMSADWVQLSAGNREYALRIEPSHEALFLLPAAPRPEVRRR
jgi:hypothetical protein